MQNNGRALGSSRKAGLSARDRFAPLGAFFLLGSLTLLTAPTGLATTISVNGTCQVGDCTHPGVLGVNQTTSGTATFTYAFANTDRYNIVVVFAASDTGGTNFSITTEGLATYEGNALGTASGTDVLTIDFSQDYQSFITSGTFQENITGTFGGDLGAGSNATFQLFQGGHPMPLLGPFLPPNSFSGSVSDFPVTGLHDPLNTTAVFTETFASGSSVGSDMNLGGVSTPEPWSLLLFGTGLVGLARARRRNVAQAVTRCHR